MRPGELEELALLRRARDRIDRDFAEPLDVAAMARAAHLSTAHFSRRFRAAYGETPHAYLRSRRIERAKALLRAGATVTAACHAVGCTSLGSFSARFTEIVGRTPSAYRGGDHTAYAVMPGCVAHAVGRPRSTTRNRCGAAGPSRDGEAPAARAGLPWRA